ncbi:phosphopantetheinyl transferase [Echinicola strongylocentroti]|uniref:Phosphopantetheinyl transferase n=1 Tax=Echinicola strongylocentroti TaxID=1795355 RepID=A0A2Z4ILF4_9BACT|nr:4'-phosphopantetheinyl transferase superfamily protein [Echinicola strongylocentroti]AWW31714.1 phosphopantetheinyl transferase [Echinicola strongylocentroti]
MNSQLYISKIHCSTVLLPTWNQQSNYLIDEHVDLWRVSVKEVMNNLEQIQQHLTAQEIKTMNRYQRESDRVRYIIGKGYLKIFLSKYLNKAPIDIEFVEGINKKPILKDTRTIHFNISHSNDWVIFGFSRDELGVDIEYVDSGFDFLSLINNCFTKPEAHYIENAYSPRHEFYKLWTRKESLLKATSIGMVDNLHAINCLDGTQYIPYEVGGGFSDWKIKSLLMDELYFVSLSFPVKYRKIRFFDVKD